MRRIHHVTRRRRQVRGLCSPGLLFGTRTIAGVLPHVDARHGQRQLLSGVFLRRPLHYLGVGESNPPTTL